MLNSFPDIKWVGVKNCPYGEGTEKRFRATLLFVTYFGFFRSPTYLTLGPPIFGFWEK
jgi:hypothetical protein